MKTTNLIARLNEMTPKHTTTILDVVVTRWTGGWEFETVGWKLDAFTVEAAAELLQARTGGEGEAQPKESTEPMFPPPVNPLGPRGKPSRARRSRLRGNPRMWGQR